MNRDKTIEQQIKDKYCKENVGKSECCIKCNKDSGGLSKPVPFWFVGSEYSKSQHKLVFIGKNAISTQGELKKSDNEIEEMVNNLWLGGRPYFSYIRDITKMLYGNDTGDSIACTNVMKCNKFTIKDTTTKEMKDNCILKMKIIRKELEILKPKKIVFMTSWGYDDYFEEIFDQIVDNQPSNKTMKKDVGKKAMPYWEFTAKIGNQEMHVLRIGHPQTKKKTDYAKLVCNWVQNTP